MKTNLIIKLAIAITWAALATARSAEPQITAKTVAQDAANEYKSALDRVIRAFVDAKGKFTLDPNDVATLRGLEYELMGDLRLGALKRADLPVLIFAEGKPQVIEEIPGRALELRLLKLNVNPWDDGLANKVFRYSVDDSDRTFTTPVPTNSYPEVGDFEASYAYAMTLIGKREWAEAVKHLREAAAVPEGTSGGEWEFQIDITRAWAEAMLGDFAKAKTTLTAALAREHRCEVPTRGRFLCAVLGIEDQHLPPEVQAALPNQN
jgi:hypothetical protein